MLTAWFLGFFLHTESHVGKECSKANGKFCRDFWMRCTFLEKRVYNGKGFHGFRAAQQEKAISVGLH
jgi:hypothetical protein